MSGKLRPWMVFGPKKWKGLQTHNSLAALALRSPQKATDAFVRLLGYKYGNTLDTLLSKFGTKTFETADEYTWKLLGPGKRNYPLLYALDENGDSIPATGMIGANQQPFTLVFSEDWTHRGATIVGDLNEVYQMVVIDEPKFQGSNTVDIYAA